MGAQRRTAEARPFPAARHGQEHAACGGGGRPPGVALWRRGHVARGGGRRPAAGTTAGDQRWPKGSRRGN
jgi:hypothetical protein